MGTYRISQLAQRSGVRASTLRFYEESGLLTAQRTPAGYRVYDERAVERLAFISSAKLMGLALDEIRDLLQAWQSGTCSSVRSELLPLVDQQITETDHRLAELSAFAARLRSVRSNLSEPAPAGRCGPDCGCTITDGQFPVPMPEGTADLGVAEATAPLGGADADPPAIACSLDREELGERTMQWQQILTHARSRTDLEDTETGVGVQLTFDNDAVMVSQLAYLIAAEQQCCSFYAFTLTVADGTVVVQVRAPRDAAPLLGELFGQPA
ncbi:MerR family transcriptional regulator [Williamsia limnetica]|nr:MerR family transcriptional regulator [Williamsia limnetica]